MKSLIVAAALAVAFAPNCALAQDRNDCWGPAQLSASAPDAESRDSNRDCSTVYQTALVVEGENEHLGGVFGVARVVDRLDPRGRMLMVLRGLSEEDRSVFP
jgi:hypothetical protein